MHRPVSKLELKDTIEGMTSDDYKQRFIAEYLQTKIRYEKLNAFIAKCEADKSVKHDCPLRLLERQARYMSLYLDVLFTRSFIEDVDVLRFNTTEEKNE